MKLKIKLLLITLVACVFQSLAQDKEAVFETSHQFKGAIAFSPGLITENTQTGQLHAYLGFRPKLTRLEIRLDGFYYLGAIGDRPRFTINHQLFAGAFYRFSDKAFQPYVGLQPGFAYSQSSEYGTVNQETGELDYQKTVNLLGSFTGGFDFFIKKQLFLFAETRYILGKHTSDTYPIFLDEWRFSFGLGFHF